MVRFNPPVFRYKRGDQNGKGGQNGSYSLIRQSAAAGRYRDEFIRASQPASARARPVFDKSTHQRASDRLAELETEMGVLAMRQLEDLLIDRATVTALTARWRMKAEDVKQVAQEALARLAVAYELSRVVDSPA